MSHFDILVKGINLGRHGKRLPESGRLSIPPGSTVGQVIDGFGMPESIVAVLLLFVNGRPARKDRILAPGDALVFFPPMEGG